MLALIGVLGAVGLLASEAPAWFAVPGALASVLAGGLHARRELGSPRRRLDVRRGRARLDGCRLDETELAWRGPLAVLRWRDREGFVRRLVWWPDTLPAATRRELRLALPPAGVRDGRPPVAP